MTVRMQRLGFVCVALFVLFAAVDQVRTRPRALAQDDDSAMQTAVADLQTRVAALEIGVATPAGTPFATPVALASPAAAEGSDLGTAVRAGDWEITVTSTEESQGFEGIFEQQTSRGVYIVVRMSLKLAANAPFAFPYNDLVLMDEAGRTFSLDADATSDWLIQNTDLTLYSELQPGLPYEVVALFDVPPDAAGLVLTSGEQLFSVRLDR